ncbi:MAG: XrtA system polysaccharide chain length determinant [Gammaproteobacteria bacterium]
MNEQIQLLRSYVRRIWPYRWTSICVAALVCLIGWAGVYSLPNQYEVNTKIFIDTRSMLRPLLKGLTVDNRVLEDSALLMRQTLLTRPNLEEVARRTDLDLKAQTPEQFDKLIAGLAENLKVVGTPRENIYQLTYVHSDPKLAKRVVDELLNTFLEATLGDTRKDTAVTQKFLDEQITEYERRLVEAEDRLKEFKRKNMGVMPGKNGASEEDYYGRLQRNEAELNQARLLLSEATHRRDELARQASGDDAVFGVADVPSNSSPVLAQVQARIDKLQQSLDDLSLRFTDKHPDIVQIKNTLAELEKQKAEEVKLISESGAGAMVAAANPAFQQIKVALANADAEVAALQTRVAEYQRRSDELRKLADTVPEVEAELKRLDRDYGLNKEQYLELVKRREAAKLSTEAEKSADDIKLKVIEPPRVPVLPSGPKRLQMISGVFGMSLVAALAIAFLMSQVFPRIYTTEELKAFTGLPVLGAVTLVQSERQRGERRMELAAFSVVFAVLLVSFGGLITADLMRVDIHGHVASLLKVPG